MHNKINVRTNCDLGPGAVWEAKFSTAPKKITDFRSTPQKMLRDTNFDPIWSQIGGNPPIITCFWPILCQKFRSTSQTPPFFVPEHPIAPKRVPEQRSPIGVLPVAPMSPTIAWFAPLE